MRKKPVIHTTILFTPENGAFSVLGKRAGTQAGAVRTFHKAPEGKAFPAGYPLPIAFPGFPILRPIRLPADRTRRSYGKRAK